MDAANKAIGCCACEAVKYVVELPARFCVHCHCAFCRRVHGAAFVTWFGVPFEQFKVGGQANLKWYYPSKDVKRGFCSTCGTSLFYISTKWPGEVHITRASVINEVEINAKFHIHFAQHVGWFPFDDAVPRVEGSDGSKRTPERDSQTTLGAGG
ncbi:MAG TPA: GFA family protein [Thermoanaerobaculia bacterium]|jgi:hypothetical protein